MSHPVRLFHADLQNVGESFCRPCLEKGHRCMTTNIVDDRHVCVFCEDGVACPVVKRQLLKRQPTAPAEPESSARKESPTMKSERQKCRFEGGCDNLINANNKLGLCKEHKGAGKKPAAKAAPKRTPRAAKKPARNTPPHHGGRPTAPTRWPRSASASGSLIASSLRSRSSARPTSSASTWPRTRSSHAA